MVNSETTLPIHKNTAGNASIQLSEKKDFCTIQLSGAVAYADYQEAFTTLLEVVKTAGLQKVVYHFKDLTKTDPAARAWFTEYYMPKAIQELGGKLKAAIITPDSMFQQMTLKFVMTMVKAKGYSLNVAYFEGEEEAYSWI